MVRDYIQLMSAALLRHKCAEFLNQGFLPWSMTLAATPLILSKKS